MKSPDVTPTQYGTITGTVVAVLAIIHQAPDRLQIPLLGALTVLGVAWLVSDAVIRHGRAGAVAAQHNLAAAQVANLPAEGNDSIVPAGRPPVAAPPAG